MQYKIATFNNDLPNKYGSRFDISALESSLMQSWQPGAMFWSHDYHRPFGISRALGLHIHSSVTALKGLVITPEDEQEADQVGRFARVFLEQRLGDFPSNEQEELEQKIADKISGEAAFVRRECVSCLDTGIAKRMFPSYFDDAQDKHGLKRISDLEQIAPGVFRIGELAIFAHRYFRRSLSAINNLNIFFLERFLKLRGDSQLTVKIALDPDSIGLARTYLTPIELEYWRGPKFNDDLSEISAGVTVHRATNNERIYHQIDRTEFLWHTQGGKLSLECEELRDEPSLGISDEVYGCRYVHSMVDQITELPDHLDGAIREYREGPYLERIDTDISRAGRNSQYKKLWRIDGPIRLNDWKGLIQDFFVDNHLVGEYLRGKNPSAPCNEENSAPRQQYRSANLVAEKDGAHISFTYHEIDSFKLHSDRALVAPTQASSEAPIFELQALELIKFFNKRSSKIFCIPEGACVIAFEDMDVNYPTFFFRGKDAVSDASILLNALGDLCSTYRRKDHRRFITASIAIEYDSAVVIFSLAGFASILEKVIRKGLNSVPDSLDGVKHWCREVQAILRHFGPFRFSKSFEDMLGLSGRFWFSRSFIDSSDIRAVNTTNGELHLTLEPSATDLANSLKLAPTIAFLVQNIKCNACGNDYIECACVACLDDECSLTIERGELIGYFLTERSAYC